MKFDREDLAQTLDVVKLAVDSRDFIPILSHFCFDGRYVTAYNDFIGIKVGLKTNFQLALQAATLLRLLGSVRTQEVEIKQAKDTVYFRSGSKRTGVRASLPYMGRDDFFFKWPSLKRYSGATLSEQAATKFLNGISQCLSSVGDQMPHQMGVTLNQTGNTLRMYSTNNKSISKYHMPAIKEAEGIDNIILPTMFCQALQKAESVYGTEECKFTVGKDFVVMQFGEDCSIYGKLVGNKDPLDFEQVIKSHTQGWREHRQAVPKDFHEIFARALLMLGNELHKTVNINVSKFTVAVEGKSSLGKVKSSSVFSKEFKGVKDLVVDAELASKASEKCNFVFFGDTAVVFSVGNYMHLVSTHQD